MEQEAPMNLIYNVDLVVKYLKRKQAWKWQYIRYSIFRKLITHVTGYSRLYYIRKIFLYMVENEYFIKEKTDKRSYLYKFKSNKETNVINKKIVVTFE
jgi:hypothetical protein